jgi:hypothetical protein
MSSDADLTTGDLARPGGGDGSEVPGSEGQVSDRRAGAEASVADQAPAGTGQTGAERSPDQGTQSWDDGTMATQDVDQEQRLGAGAGAGQGMQQPPGSAPGVSGSGASASAGGGQGADMALLDPSDGQRFKQRWADVQARFVDDPREAVQTADGLVAELMQSLAASFNEHKGRLESAWQSGDDPDTEELRQALQRYRSFFDRLLST